MSPSRSLTFQILVHFLAAVGFVALGGMGVMYLGGTRVLESWVVRSNRFLARAVQKHLEQDLGRGLHLAMRLAARLETIDDPVKREQQMEQFLTYNELFSNAYIFRADGTLIAACYASSHQPNQGVGTESFNGYPGPFPEVARSVLKTGKPRMSPIYHTASGRPQLVYVQPLRGRDGRPAAVLSLALYAVSEHVNSWIQGLEPSHRGYVAVIDTNGRALALSGKAPKAMERTAEHPIDTRRWPGPEEVIHTAIDGREDLVIQERLPPSSPFVVWVGLPRSVAYAPLRDLQLPAVAALVAALLTGALCSTLLARRILRPLARLVGGIRRVGEGVLSHRVPIDRRDELGEAADAFNRMVDRWHRNQLVEDVWREVHRT